jgi:hypothetical protein
MLRKTIVAGLVSLVSLVSTEALPAIASYPATQWSGTRFNASKDVCVSNATAALQANKFSEINSSGINVYGHTAQTVATIFCTPSNNAIYEPIPLISETRYRNKQGEGKHRNTL